MITSSISVIGAEADLRDILADIETKFPYALEYVSAEIRDALQKHLQSDLFGAYTPEHYTRRRGNTERGRAIEDEGNISSEIVGNSLRFSYEPEGENTPYNHQIFGDHLIYILQKAEGYNWGDNIPPRPFWNSMIDDLKDGRIMSAFANGMTAQGYTVTGTQGIDGLDEYKI